MELLKLVPAFKLLPLLFVADGFWTYAYEGVACFQCAEQRLRNHVSSALSLGVADLRSRIQLAKRVLKVLTLAKQTGYDDLPELVEERFEMLLEGTLAERLRRHLGFILTRHERQLGLRR